jgi:hypothetical protein
VSIIFSLPHWQITHCHIIKELTMKKIILTIGILVLMENLLANTGKDTIYPIFQFPANRIPTVDGNAADWDIIPDFYIIGTDQLWDDSRKHEGLNRKSIDVKVKVGWVKGLNRLYFLYEAYDDYWDFSQPGLHNDTYELVVDGDLSGGPLVGRERNKVWTKEAFGEMADSDSRVDLTDDRWLRHGVHAQNYHIFTPAEGKDWTMVFGVQPWIKELPYANAAYNYKFRPGEGGKLILEFWITPFDYAPADGAVRAVESLLYENKRIGLCWAIIDYDDTNKTENNGFWNLSKKHTMYGNASQLCLFQLMPLEKQFRKTIEAQWSFKVVDMERRLVAFKDLSYGKITSWKWDFGDGTSSTEQHPIHQYKEKGDYVVVLYVEGPEGKAQRSKVWDVSVR